MASAARFSISADQYLEKYHVLFYMEDAVSQLLEHKEDNPKVNTNRFFSDYFTSVRDGNHTLFREYDYITGTPHNRASFVKTFWKCFKHIGKKGDLLTMKEYHCLVELLCPDFPFQLVQRTARIILMDDALDCLISFTDFLYAFQAQLYYEEFMSKAEVIYSALKTCSPRELVIVPSTSDVRQASRRTSSDNTSGCTDTVDGAQFYNRLAALCTSAEDFSVPPISILKTILSGVAPQVSFYGFLMALTKSDSINSHIGKLPPKEELLHIPDNELISLPPIFNSEGKTSRPVSGSQKPRNSASNPSSATDRKPPITNGLSSLNQPITTSEIIKKVLGKNDRQLNMRRDNDSSDDTDDDDDNDDDDESGSSTN